MNPFVVYYPEGHEAHFEYGHPERPERVEAVRSSLESLGWWDEFIHLEPAELDDEILYAVHSQSYIGVLQSACERGMHLDADTYTTTASWQLALNAAGGAIAVADYVWQVAESGEKDAQAKGFALTRPPGHHATVNRGMGFCLLNNIALVAEYLLQRRSASRIAIVDLDLHHGNGTQDIFYARDDVLYISTHQSPLYPGTGAVEETGVGQGDGFTANFPLPPATGDEGFRSIMDTLILPLVDRYHPQMILVSFGFDPHWRDPLGYLQLSASGYRDLIRSLAQWTDHNCKGKISLYLEGGYDLDAGRACSQAVVSALVDQPFNDFLGPSPRPEGKSWQVTARRAREIWDL